MGGERRIFFFVIYHFVKMLNRPDKATVSIVQHISKRFGNSHSEQTNDKRNV